jgi:hypothetical protein
LGKTISFLSYIDLGFIGKFGKLAPNKENDKIYYREYDVIDNDNYSSIYLKMYNINHLSSSYLGLYFKATTPILVLSRDIIFDAGVSFGANIIKTEINYLYDYNRSKVIYNNGYHATNLGSGNNISASDNQSKTSFYITPLFDIYSSFLTPVIVSLTVGVDFGCLSAGIEF